MTFRRETRVEGGAPADLDAVAGFVHELRQPLAGLDAGLRLLSHALGDSVTRLDGWRIATAQLARLSETLETYDQIISPRRSGDSMFAVDTVVRRAVEGVRHRVQARPERLALVVDADVPRPAATRARCSTPSRTCSPTRSTRWKRRAVPGASRCACGAPRGSRRARRCASPTTASGSRRIACRGSSRRGSRRRCVAMASGSRSAAGCCARPGELRLAGARDPDRRPWSRTELVVDLVTPDGVAAPRDLPAPAPRRATRAAGVGAAVVALLAVGAGAWRLERSRREPDLERVAAPAPVEVIAEVLESGGTLERLRGEAWEPVAVGARLLADDNRTAAGSGAIVGLGGTRVEVSDATQLTVREITAAVQRLRLSRGRIAVDHQPDGARVLVVEAERASSSVRARSARFSVLASGSALAVAADAGVVRLQSAAGAVDVGAGEQAVAFASAAPSAPRPIPAALLLRVASGVSKPIRAGGEACRIEGEAEPGSEVTIDGRPIEADAQGRFAIELPAGRGAGATVVTRNAAGRVTRRRVPCFVEHDVSDFVVRWGQDAPERR